MGRPEAPIPPEASAFGGIVADLRTLRQHAGLTYRELSDRAHYAASVLSEAASGKSLPRWEVVQAYVAACGDHDLDTWRRRWELAAQQKAQTLSPPHRLRPVSLELTRRLTPVRSVTTRTNTSSGDLPAIPDPQNLATPEAFLDALRQLKQRSGLSYAQMSNITRENTALPYVVSKSTLHAVLTGRRPPQAESVSALVVACGVDEHAQREWIQAWRRLDWQNQSPPPATTQQTNPTPTFGKLIPRSRVIAVVIAASIVFLVLGYLIGTTIH